MATSILPLFLVSLAAQRALCNCDYGCWGSSEGSPNARNISLVDSALFYFDRYGNIYDCPGRELHWKILRADGETELYPEEYADEVFNIYIYSCSSYCFADMMITPRDLRYDGAQITAILSLPGCSDSPYSSNVMTLHIQGLLAPPAEVQVEQVSVDTVSVSWSPPFTLEGVPILHYTVYTTSSTGYSEAVNTTQTQVSLQRPCTDTSYQVSGWNEVGEGNTSSTLTYSRGLPTPPTSVTITSRSAELQISWSAPADWEDCITHYSIYTTDSSGAVSVTNTTDGGTSYTVDKPCSDVEVEVSGWSEGGGGERSSPKQLYTELTVSETVVKTIRNLTNSLICAYCSFTAGSEAEGCAVELESEAHTYLFNMSRSTSGGGELSQSVLDCFTVGEAGDYSVHVYEIQCNGELGHRNKELPDVTVESIERGIMPSSIMDDKKTSTMAERLTATHSSNDSVVIALAVMLGLTVVGLVVAILACVTAAVVMKWRTNLRNKHSTTSAGEPSPQTTAATESAVPPADNVYEQIELKPNYEEVELSTNAAYGMVRR